MTMRVLISHAHDERALAEAWKKLLTDISNGLIEPWYSSDNSATGGMPIGEEWRTQLGERITESRFILALLTPSSRDRPWILWECGVASGVDKERGIIPILYSMSAKDLANPLSTYQVYQGDAERSVMEVCTRLVTQAQAPRPATHLWGPAIQEYLTVVAAHRPRRAQRLEDMTLWRTRFEQLLQSGRAEELPARREAMYATLGKGFTPLDVNLHELLSKALLDLKRYAEALVEVDRALFLAPEDVELLHRKALAATGLKDYPTAMKTLEEVFRLEPSLRSLPEFAGLEGRIHRELYMSSLDRQELDLARDAYRRAFDAHPSSYFCGVNLASLSLMAGDLPDAAAVYGRVLVEAQKQREKKNVSFWADFTVGECHLGLGQVDEAYAAYSEGLRRAPPPAPRDRRSALDGVNRLIHQKRLGAAVSERFERLLGDAAH
jgi:tetratricopeptide (TPR) repeat protein